MMFEIYNIPRASLWAQTPPPSFIHSMYVVCRPNNLGAKHKLTATLAMCRGTDSLGYDKKLACELNLIARNLDHVY